MSAVATSTEKLSDRIRSRTRALSPSLVRVLEYIDAHRHEVMTQSAMELAAAIGTSDATVVRAVQAAGFQGLKELRRALASTLGEGRSPIDTVQRTIESLREHSSTAVDRIFSDHHEALASLDTPEARASILSAVGHISSAKRVGLYGIGSTAFLARYIALSLNRIGRPTAVFDGYTAPLPEQLLEMRNVDVLLMMAYGPPCKEMTLTIAEARRLKVPIVAITNSTDPAILRHADVALPVSSGHAGRIVIHGTTLVCLEAIVFAVVAADPPKTISALESLGHLRRSLYK